MKKPNCKLIGEDGNIFNLMGLTSRVLKENNQTNKANEMVKRITEGNNVDYNMALCIIGEYVNIC